MPVDEDPHLIAIGGADRAVIFHALHHGEPREKFGESAAVKDTPPAVHRVSPNPRPTGSPQ